LAVLAHIRHAETRYDSLLAAGFDRWEARATVEDDTARIAEQWAARE
jgi:hypothetical protein